MEGKAYGRKKDRRDQCDEMDVVLFLCHWKSSAPLFLARMDDVKGTRDSILISFLISKTEFSYVIFRLV